MSDKINGKTSFVWLQGDAISMADRMSRGDNTARFAETIIAACPEICTNGAGLYWLDDTGGLDQINLARFREILDQRIACPKVVKRGGAWARVGAPYAFAPKADTSKEPDNEVLRQLYQHEVVLRAPKIQP